MNIDSLFYSPNGEVIRELKLELERWVEIECVWWV